MYRRPKPDMWHQEYQNMKHGATDIAGEPISSPAVDKNLLLVIVWAPLARLVFARLVSVVRATLARLVFTRHVAALDLPVRRSGWHTWGPILGCNYRAIPSLGPW